MAREILVANSWWPDLGSWAAAPQSGVSHSRLLSWHGGRRLLPTKGEVQEDLCLRLAPSSLEQQFVALWVGLWTGTSRDAGLLAVPRAAVPHLLWGKEAPSQAETSCRLGLACRPQLVSAELAHPCCNCAENYPLGQDLYILISIVWCGVCGYNQSHSDSSFCYCFERQYL